MIRWVWHKIDHHFFEPAYITDLSIIRTVIVFVQLSFLILSLFGISFGNHAGLLSLKAAVSFDIQEYSPVIILKLFLLPFGWGVRPDIMFVYSIWITALIAGFTSLFGVYKKLSLFLFTASCTILIAYAYSFKEQHHTEAILILFLWVLVFGDNNRTWSIDNLKKRIFASNIKMKFIPYDRYQKDVFSRWPVRVMQWLFVIVYFSAGLEKLKGGFNHYSMMLSMAKDGILFDRSIALWMAENPLLLQVIAPVAVLFELTFPLVMLLPGITWVYVLIGSLFHFSIYIIHAPPFLHYIVLYIVFLEPVRNSWKKRFTSSKKLKWTIIYDGFCPLCVRSVTVIDYLDFYKRFEYLDLERNWDVVQSRNYYIEQDDARRALYLISSDGKKYQGFYAFRRLTLLIPLLLPLSPFLYIPYVDKAGNYLYSFVAANRKRKICTFDNCEL